MADIKKHPAQTPWVFRPDQSVFSAGGVKVGTVADWNDRTISVRKTFLFFFSRRFEIPVSLVSSVDRYSVHLSVSTDDVANQTWRTAGGAGSTRPSAGHDQPRSGDQPTPQPVATQTPQAPASSGVGVEPESREGATSEPAPVQEQEAEISPERPPDNTEAPTEPIPDLQSFAARAADSRAETIEDASSPLDPFTPTSEEAEALNADLASRSAGEPHWIDEQEPTGAADASPVSETAPRETQADETETTGQDARPAEHSELLVRPDIADATASASDEALEHRQHADRSELDDARATAGAVFGENDPDLPDVAVEAALLHHIDHDAPDDQGDILDNPRTEPGEAIVRGAGETAGAAIEASDQIEPAPPGETGSTTASPEAEKGSAGELRHDTTSAVDQAGDIAAQGAANDESAPPSTTSDVTRSAAATDERRLGDPETEGTEWVRAEGRREAPEGFPIKGNADSGIYHTHASRGYHSTIPELFFATEEAAARAGYRPPRGLDQAKGAGDAPESPGAGGTADALVTQDAPDDDASTATSSAPATPASGAFTTASPVAGVDSSRSGTAPPEAEEAGSGPEGSPQHARQLDGMTAQSNSAPAETIPADQGDTTTSSAQAISDDTTRGDEVSAGDLRSTPDRDRGAARESGGADARSRPLRTGSPETEGVDWIRAEGRREPPAGFPIKGNANSGIYHTAESSAYSSTIAEIYFSSPEAAQRAGYRLPKNMEQGGEQSTSDSRDSAANAARRRRRGNKHS